uniref:Gelsolin-like domain-containing protein n=1 Tax=Mesocestoides corti TaxID=53468 RepID=A0A5K3EYL0_MESCO
MLETSHLQNPFTSLLSDEPVDPLPNPPKAFEKALLRYWLTQDLVVCDVELKCHLITLLFLRCRLSDDSGALKLIPVCRGRISHAGLEPTDVNFVDTIDGLFIYVGPTASKREREGAWSEARKYLSNMQRPYMSVHFLKAGQKSYEFDEIWDDYE